MKWFCWSHYGLANDCYILLITTEEASIDYDSVDHTEALSMVVIIMLITEASSMVVMVLLITTRLRQWLCWFCWSHRGTLHGFEASPTVCCDGSVDHTEASFIYSIVAMVLLITLKPRLWLWWFCWSHWSVVYGCDGSDDHTKSLVYGCDGSDDHTEASSMVVMVLMITLKPRLWLWWFWWSHWSLVYGCDGSVGSRQQFPSTGPARQNNKRWSLQSEVGWGIRYGTWLFENFDF